MLNKETGEVIFRFRKEPGISYEILNTPPDEGEPSPGAAAEVAPPDSPHVHSGSEQPPDDHFQFYYKLFLDPDVEKFGFKSAAPPAPSPARCGWVFLSKRRAPLTE